MASAIQQHAFSIAYDIVVKTKFKCNVLEWKYLLSSNLFTTFFKSLFREEYYILPRVNSMIWYPALVTVIRQAWQMTYGQYRNKFTVVVMVLYTVYITENIFLHEITLQKITIKHTTIRIMVKVKKTGIRDGLLELVLVFI